MSNVNENADKLNEIVRQSGHSSVFTDKNIAHLYIHANEVVSSHTIPGLNVDVKSIEDGVEIKILLEEGSKIENPVHMCFGNFPETGIQRILLDLELEKDSAMDVFAHCAFPFATDFQHIMDAEIRIGENAVYNYFERHIHGLVGGAKVYPKAVMYLAKNSRFKTEFELIKGRVGLIEIDFESVCEAYSVAEMVARCNGKEDDKINIRETAKLIGEGARSALITKIAARGRTVAEVYNKIVATAAYAKGHVDCKEIIQDNGSASAIPIVEVKHPKAHVTHEAAIGSVDNKQLETLMARGLDEDTASELIIQGMLNS